jgi:hypothetical protein
MIVENSRGPAVNAPMLKVHCVAKPVFSDGSELDILPSHAALL